MLKLAEAVACFESWTCAVNELATDAVGVPEIAPELPFRLSPVGKLPALIPHWYGGIPPDALRLLEYAEPTSPVGNELVVTASGDVAALIVIARLADATF
jgi:hypothetical protein